MSSSSSLAVGIGVSWFPASSDKCECFRLAAWKQYLEEHTEELSLRGAKILEIGADQASFPSVASIPGCVCLSVLSLFQKMLTRTTVIIHADCLTAVV